MRARDVAQLTSNGTRTVHAGGSGTELDDFAGPLEATVMAKPKPNAVKQEIEKNDELVRSALRAVSALTRLSDDGTGCCMGRARAPRLSRTVH